MKHTTKTTRTAKGINVEYNFKLPKEDSPKIAKIMISVVAFFFTNFIFLIYGIVKLVRVETYTAYNVLSFFLLFGLGVFFTAIVIFLAYKYALITVVKSGYKYMTPFFKTVSDMLAQKYAEDEKFKEKINKVFDFKDTLGGIYGRHMPWIMKKALSFFINRIPFVEFLKNLSPDTNSKDVKAVSEAIYNQMDEYIVKKLFTSNNMKWIFFLFPVNMAVQFVFLAFIK